MTTRLTIKSVRAALPSGITLTVKDGEYLVRIKGSPRGHGYYTNDLQDALFTAKFIAQKLTTQEYAYTQLA